MKHEQELDEMQQNQPQPEFSQDHIVRRLISRFRKPSDAGAISSMSGQPSSSNMLQVPPAHVPTVSGQVSSAAGDQQHASSSSGDHPQQQHQQHQPMAGIQRSLAGKQSKWSQLVASAAAGAASKPAPASQQQQQPAVSSTRSLLDISHGDAHAESSSNRSSADGRDDEVDENYFRPGGKGHQALLDNMDKR